MTASSDSFAISWLAAHGHIKEAELALALTRGLSAEAAGGDYVISREVEEIRSSVEAEKNVRAGWLECFNPEHKLLYRTLLGKLKKVPFLSVGAYQTSGMALQSLQQLTGANYFFYYGATIFQSVGISDSFVTQIILGAVNFGCTFGGLYVMERVSLQRLLVVRLSYDF